MNKFSILAFGANQEFNGISPENIVSEAMNALVEREFKLISMSRLYATPAFPAGSGPDYVNACACVETNQSAEEILVKLHAVEAVFGRERTKRWGQRTLDIDLIACGDEVYPNLDIQTLWRELSPEDQQVKAPEKLILPHPRLQDRAFVLVPLADIAPEWCHPILGLSVAQMLENLPDSAKNEVVAL